MKYIDEFRNRSLTDKLASRIRLASSLRREYRYMEVCGTHTMAIFRFGLRDILPANIKLISGPGCPVCVTPVEYLDRAIEIAKLPGCIVTTFGDMLRVPGSRSSLEKTRGSGGNVKTVYSTDDALDIAKRNPGKEVVFLGVGFETTVPTVAASIITAKTRGVDNYSVLSAHKTMPEALNALVADGGIDIDGFLLPGHVSAIIGTKPYEFLAKEYNMGCVAAGFESVDILQGILMLIDQDRPRVEIQYKRIVSPSGNPLARKIMDRVFEKCPSIWRGIGKVKDSGLRIRREFSDFDASLKFNPQTEIPRLKSGNECDRSPGGREPRALARGGSTVKRPRAHENGACICGMILKGIKTPPECGLFAGKCAPANPVGACMVSAEGTCAAWYKYGRR